MNDATDSDVPNHPQLLRDLHTEIEKRGLFASSHFWRRKLLFWGAGLFRFVLRHDGGAVRPLWLLWRRSPRSRC
jgi:hypothetical protein